MTVAGDYSALGAALQSLYGALVPSAADFHPVALGGTVPNEVALQQLLDCGAPDVFIPAGTYHLAPSASLLLKANQRIRGAGRLRTNIISDNAYAFSAPMTGSLDRVVLQDMSLLLKPGSTIGGAIRAKSNSYHADWLIERVYGDGLPLSVDAIFDLNGMIGSYLHQCQAQNGKVGFRIANDGFPSNAMLIRESRASSCSVSGIHLIGGGLQRIEDSVLENNGLGVLIEGVAMAQVLGNWLENQSAADVRVTGTANHTRILRNKMHYHKAGSTSAHIELVGPAAPGTLAGVEIAENYAADPSGAGVGVMIDANTSDTKVFDNTFADPVFLQDNGTGTQKRGQTSGYGMVPNVVTQPFQSGTRAYYGGQLPAIALQRLVNQTAPLLAGYDVDGTTLLAAISASGYIVIAKQGAPVAGELGVGQVALWLDLTPGACKLKVRGRNLTGATINGEIALT